MLALLGKFLISISYREITTQVKAQNMKVLFVLCVERVRRDGCNY
jgi:hypothetical protein